MAPTQELINVKLLLIGISSVGKTSFLLCFSDKQWFPEDETSAAIDVDFRVNWGSGGARSTWCSHSGSGAASACLVHSPAPQQDSAGQEHFRTITASHYHGTQGVILVYDVSNRESFEALSRWLEELENYVPPEVITIVGNKPDNVCRHRGRVVRLAHEVPIRRGNDICQDGKLVLRRVDAVRVELATRRQL
ncbi:P-loop containing nucleoside triphosphate hydrolase protein [Lactarius indigo]|nr:P-loop containing nucleoside triphosphate hydrolase protein [Lactarius indigo]